MNVPLNILHCETRAEWRAWLEKNFVSARHGGEPQEIWLVYYKKGYKIRNGQGERLV